MAADNLIGEVLQAGPVLLPTVPACTGTHRACMCLHVLSPMFSVCWLAQVPLGGVTPLAVANTEAANVVLLLDQLLQSQAVLFVHPLVNNVSMGLTPAALDEALRSGGGGRAGVRWQVESQSGVWCGGSRGWRGAVGTGGRGGAGQARGVEGGGGSCERGRCSGWMQCVYGSQAEGAVSRLC